jgi:recombination protein RecR
MQITSETLERAIEQLAKLPGVGRKSAQRLAMHLLKQEKDQVFRLAETLKDLKEKILYCETCFNITDQSPCAICRSEKRNKQLICVVEDARDVYVIEKTGEYRGVYHVLGGVISPLESIGPNEIRVKELVTRVSTSEPEVEEIILALNPDAEGEATSFYINKLLKPFGVKITRIAQGIPMGSELEYIDDATLSRAFMGRSIF